jgi:hypothetical protein
MAADKNFLIISIINSKGLYENYFTSKTMNKLNLICYLYIQKNIVFSLISCKTL